MIPLNGRPLLGVVLIVAAVLLASEPVYTSIKGAAVGAGAPVVVAVAAAWVVIVLALVIGIVLVRRS